MKKEALQHLGVKPGGKIEYELLPNGKVVLDAVSTKGNFEDFFGMLHDPDRPALSIEEMNQIIADGWAGKR